MTIFLPCSAPNSCNSLWSGHKPTAYRPARAQSPQLARWVGAATRQGAKDDPAIRRRSREVVYSRACSLERGPLQKPSHRASRDANKFCSPNGLTRLPLVPVASVRMVMQLSPGALRRGSDFVRDLGG